MSRPETTPLLAVAVLVTLAACGNDDAEPETITEIAEQVGCEDPQPASTEELYVQDAVECADGSRLLTFASNAARDDFVEIAEHFGGSYETGDRYAVEAPD
jgi:hypothetical protein